MGSKQKYIKGNTFDFEDDFIDSLAELEDIILKIKIGRYIEENLKDYPVNKLTTYVVGGFVRHNNESVYFAIEILRSPRMNIVLTDFHLIDTNEYLDLINLNCYIKNEKSI